MTGNLGNKCNCSKCSAKFYDLGKKKPACPKCGASFVDEKVMAPIVVEAVEAPSDEKTGKEQEIDDVGDIDLSDFNDDTSEEKLELKTTSEGSALADIEDAHELDEPIESISELEDIEIEADIRNSDDAEDSVAIEDMDHLETIIDKIEDEEAQEEEED